MPAQAANGVSPPVLLLASCLGATVGVAVAAWIYTHTQEDHFYPPKPAKPVAGRTPETGTTGPVVSKAVERKKRREAAKNARKAAAVERLTETRTEESGAAPQRASASAGSEECVPAPRRDLVCKDALEWLKNTELPPKAVILTGIPDVCEVQNFAPSMKEWEVWFVRAAASVLEALPAGSLAVFVQTDLREGNKGQVSKVALVLQAATGVQGVRLLWHKIAHFGTVDEPSEGKVKYSHLLCFRRCRGDEVDTEHACGVPDVVWRGLKPRGLKKSMRCFGVNMTRVVLQWASRQYGADTAVDPFCGAGTVLAVANALGLHAIGVDISPRRVKQAALLDGEALLTYERDVANSAVQLRGTPGGDLASTGVKLSARALKQVQNNFKGMSQSLLKGKAAPAAPES